jgi:hypothetical protein
MPVLASDIISRAQIVVQDMTGVRWPLAELLQWLNDGQRELVVYKPTATATTAVLPLQAGTLQVAGADDLAILRIVRNIKVPVSNPRIGGRACRAVAREVLDAQHPSWHDPSVFPYAREARHFCFDEVDPKAFYVFPGNDGTGALEVVVSRLPAPLELPPGADADNAVSYRLPLGVPDIYANCLLDYVLFRAYAKDADHPANAERSAKHYELFTSPLVAKVQNENTVNPNRGPSA